MEQHNRIKKLIKFTEDLDRDEWLVWVTDDEQNLKHNKPDWMMVKNLPSETIVIYWTNVLSLCFVDDYMTWNLSVQDD